MTKADVKLLCEADDQLSWWAMVLFAEICDFVEAAKQQDAPDKMIADYVRGKNEEFPRLVVHQQITKAKTEAEKEQS